MIFTLKKKIKKRREKKSRSWANKSQTLLLFLDLDCCTEEFCVRCGTAYVCRKSVLFNHIIFYLEVKPFCDILVNIAEIYP